MKVNIFSYITDYNEPKCGLQVHAINFVKAMNKYADAYLYPLQQFFPNILKDNELKKILDKNNRIDLDSPSIVIGDARDFARFRGSINIAFSVFETTKIPEFTLNMHRYLDYIWVPSKWGKQILIENGIKPEKVKIMPEGVDTEFFKPEGPVIDYIKNDNTFKFLCVGKLEVRKSQIELIEAFIEEFRENVSVSLYLSCSNNDSDAYNKRIGTIKKDLKSRNITNIKFVDYLQEEDVPKLYNSCDAFVLPTKGEGWGLPIIEAAASGLPVITTYYSGQSEYLLKDFIYEIKIDEFEDVYDPWFFQDKGNHGKWAVISKENIKTQLRTVYENQSEARKKAKKMLHHVVNNWTWENAAKKATLELKRIMEMK